MGLIKKMGGRKFSLVLLLIALTVCAVATRTEVPPALVDLVKWVVGLYMAGNVGRAGVDKFGAANGKEGG